MRPIPLAFLMLAACGSAATAPKWPSSPCHQLLFEATRFTVCDPGQGKLKLVAASKSEAPLRTFAEVATLLSAERVAFAMNAGMFDEDGRPIGLAVVEGAQVHAINLRGGGGNFHLMPNGVFLVRKSGAASIVTSDAFKMAPDIALATQSGPMLVIDGKLHPKFDPDGESRLIRNGVGITSDGNALFVISNEVVSFGKLARFFRDGLHARNALYFDGSVSSLWDPASGRHDAGVPLGPMIVAMKHAPSSRSVASAPDRARRARP